MKKVEFLYLSQEDIISLKLGWDVIIKQVELANSEFVRNTVECPPKRGVHTRPDCFIHEMPVYLKTMDACGIKWVSGYPDNYKHDLPQIAGIQVLNDPVTGIPTCVMDCRWITGVRTAAATAITMKYCAKSDSRKIAIIGAGVQGRMHLLAIKHVLPDIEECHIFDIKQNMLDFYVKTMTEKTGCKIIPFNSVKEAVQDSDIIVTCTQRLHAPIIEAEDFKPGMTGAGLEAGRAWSAELLHGVKKIITDDLEQTLGYQSSPGAFPGGMPEFYCQLGEIINGTKPGRENDTEQILAFNIGFAAEDIALGQYIYETAKNKAIGRMLTLMEEEI